MQFERELQLARSAAMHSGELAIGYQSKGIQAETKSDDSPVTIADRECEKLICNEILSHFPDDGILGEEGANKASRNGRKWIIDPIDGTRDFVRGYPLWAVLIGLEVDGEVVLGVSHLAPRREMYWAVKGHGSYCNDTRVHISDRKLASESVMCLNGFHGIWTQPFAPELLKWLSQFFAVRSFGGCVDAMMVASGMAEAWIENTAQAWDLAPLKIILEEAGAQFRNFDGGNSIYGGDCVAYVPALQPVFEKLLRP
jgi:fructose-1,6-bisphosphatase/inositol monophosphatase family enzyme